MRLGLLDKSPVQKGEGAAAALARTVDIARTAERFGFHRFWLAGHHGIPAFASSVPEVLIAHILARTSHIRVGSGGIMLQHYSAYKVAETFNTLSALAPGRVDLGIGKAPGGFPFSTKALQAGRDAQRWPAFDVQVRELDSYLAQGPEQPSGAVATPSPPTPPERFLLGGSVDSAILAAEQGWRFVFAGHMNGDPALTEQSLIRFARSGGRGAPLLSVLVLAAERRADAEKQVAGLAGVKVLFRNGHSVNLGNREQAAEYAQQAGLHDYDIIDTKPSVIAGTQDDVHRELEQIKWRFGVEEFIVETPPVLAAERRRSIELLGETLGFHDASG